MFSSVFTFFFFCTGIQPSLPQLSQQQMGGASQQMSLQQQQQVQGVQQQQQQLARVVWSGIMELTEVVSCIDMPLIHENLAQFLHDLHTCICGSHS